MSAAGMVLLGAALESVIAAVRRILDELTRANADATSLIPDPRTRAYARAMCDEFGARIRVKDTVAMRIAAAAFDVAGLFTTGLPDGDAFLRRYATTIGAEIFIPAEMLSGDPLELQELIAHEMQHVFQFRSLGFAFAWLYTVEPEARAVYEAYAFGAGAAVRFLVRGEMGDVDQVLPDLVASYHVRREDQHLARDMMLSLMASIRSGIVSTVAGRNACTWLRENPSSAFQPAVG